MKRIILPLIVTLLVIGLSNCSKKQEISPERFQVLADTLVQELDYAVWMDLAFEMASNYADKYEAAVVLAQGLERSVLEGDEARLNQFVDFLHNYPENGALTFADQISIGNQLAWVMSTQSFLPASAQEIMDRTIELFEQNKTGMQWVDQMGAAIYGTQALLHSNAGDPDKALLAYDKSIEFWEQPDALVQRALLYEEKGDLSSALEDYITALGLSPDQPMLISKVKEVFSALNPDQDAAQFIRDIKESLNEKRKEEVLAEAIFLDAPDFSFTDFAGQTLNNTNQRGKVVFVDFWATWCGPCRRELPEFQKFYDQHKNNPRISFIAASTDQDRSKVQPYVDDMGFTFPIAFDGGNAPKFGVEGIPSLFIIGPEGKIRYKIVGFDPDKDFVAEMNWRLESLLDS